MNITKVIEVHADEQSMQDGISACILCVYSVCVCVNSINKSNKIIIIIKHICVLPALVPLTNIGLCESTVMIL